MALVVPENFTRDMIQRLNLIIKRVNVSQDILNGSTIEIYEDVTGMRETERVCCLVVDL